MLINETLFLVWYAKWLPRLAHRWPTWEDGSLHQKCTWKSFMDTMDYRTMAETRRASDSAKDSGRRVQAILFRAVSSAWAPLIKSGFTQKPRDKPFNFFFSSTR